jgi:molecular chaperone HscB
MIADNHFFAVFGLPVAFMIDKIALKDKLLALQKQHHPDQATPDKKHQAEQNASLINHAFDTLYHDDARAMYLLSLSGQVLENDKSIYDEAFLGQMMSFRMDLEDSQNPDEVHAIDKALRPLMSSTAQAFDQSYTTKDWEQATAHAQKLQFLHKLHLDVLAKLSEFHASQDDDDLYV